MYKFILNIQEVESKELIESLRISGLRVQLKEEIYGLSRAIF